MKSDELGAAERRDLKASFHREWRRNEELRAENERIKSELVSDALLPKLFAERDELRAEVERLRAEMERLLRSYPPHPYEEGGKGELNGEPINVCARCGAWKGWPGHDD